MSAFFITHIFYDLRNETLNELPNLVSLPDSPSVLKRKNFVQDRILQLDMGDAAGMEGSSLAKIFVGGLDRSIDEVRFSFI